VCVCVFRDYVGERELGERICSVISCKYTLCVCACVCVFVFVFVHVFVRLYCVCVGGVSSVRESVLSHHLHFETIHWPVVCMCVCVCVCVFVFVRVFVRLYCVCVGGRGLGQRICSFALFASCNYTLAGCVYVCV